MVRALTRHTARPQAESAPVASGSPVEIRLIGHESDVRRLVAAMQKAADGSASPVSYRPSRYTTGALRAYLTVVIPPVEEQS